MNTNDILEMLMFTLPALVTGGIAYYFFKEHVNNEMNRRRYLIQKELEKESLPLRLQAYERMVLLLERIAPSKLLVRINPTSNDKNDYESLLIATIEQEFDHNLTQQIYISDECWTVITTSKNSIIQLIRKANMNEKVDSAQKLREFILTELMDKQTPQSTALSYVKQEVKELFG